MNRGRDVQAEGCLEHFDTEFLRWVWRYPKDGRPLLEKAIEQHGAEATVLELRTPSQVRAFPRDIDSWRP